MTAERLGFRVLLLQFLLGLYSLWTYGFSPKVWGSMRAEAMADES